MVEDAIKNAPSTLLLAGRVPENDYVIHNKTVAFTNFGEGVKVVNPHTRKAELSTKKHLADATRICDALENITVYERALGADDVPVEVQSIHNAEAIFNNTTNTALSALTAVTMPVASLKWPKPSSARKRAAATSHLYAPLLSQQPVDPKPRHFRGHHGSSTGRHSCQRPFHGFGRWNISGNFGRDTGLSQCRSTVGSCPLPAGSSGKSFHLRKFYYDDGHAFHHRRRRRFGTGMLNAGVAQLAQFYKLPSFVAGRLG